MTTATTWWECGCRAVNDTAQKVCEQCGADRVVPVDAAAPPTAAKVLPPAYRVMPPRDYVRDAEDAPCTEPDCPLTLADHKAEWRQKMAVIFTRVESTR